MINKINRFLNRPYVIALAIGINVGNGLVSLWLHRWLYAIASLIWIINLWIVYCSVRQNEETQKYVRKTQDDIKLVTAMLEDRIRRD